MKFYELVVILRSDLHSTDVDNFTGWISDLVGKYKGKVVKHEYWGLRSLAYKIDNSKKGHYVMFVLEALDTEFCKDSVFCHHSDLMRYHVVKTDSVMEDPSPILKSKTIVDEEQVKLN